MAINATPIMAGIAAIAVALSPAARIFLSEDADRLSEYQAQCNTLHAVHTVEMANLGIFFKAGEALRSPWQAAEYARQGIGIAGSLHTRSLAFDQFVFVPKMVNGKHQLEVSMNPADYKFAGERWEQLGQKYGIPTTWGGRFNDAVHFSCSWEGKK